MARESITTKGRDSIVLRLVVVRARKKEKRPGKRVNVACRGGGRSARDEGSASVGKAADQDLRAGAAHLVSGHVDMLHSKIPSRCYHPFHARTGQAEFLLVHTSGLLPLRVL